MNIQFVFGQFSRKCGFELCKVFVALIFFSLWYEVHTIRMEWSLVSPYQLSQQQNAKNWYPLEGGDRADVDFSKGGQIAFVPASQYGIFNRPLSPRVINVYTSKPNSSEEHKHKNKLHPDYSNHEPEYHHGDHPKHHEQHHKSPKEKLNDEHIEQAEVAGQMADKFSKMIAQKKSQMLHHVKMRDEELERGNVEAAKKEQAIINIHQKQIKYLEGIEQAEEAIMTGEYSMYYDDDAADQKHGEGHGYHGNHHGKHNDDEGKHEHGHHGHDNHEGKHEHGHHGHDDDDDDDDDEGKHGHGHHGHDDDHEGEDYEDHEQHDEDDHEHHGDQAEDEYHDAGEQFEGNDDVDNDPDYNPEDEHNVDRRSPLLTSYLPPFGTSTPIPSPDTVALDTAAAKVDAAAGTAANMTPPPPPSLTSSTTEVSATADASASANSAATVTPTVTNTADSNSGWLSWLSSSPNPSYSPYGFLKYLSPSDKSSDNLMSIFNTYSNPSNSGYLANASTLMRIAMFFMPGAGIVEQVYFTMAISKTMWKAGTMYYEGYGVTDIAVIVLPEMAEAYFSRRGEDSIINQKILTPGVYGEAIKIDGMEVPAFLKYVKNMKYPDLTEAQEEILHKDIDNLVTITYPDISPELKTTYCTGLKDTLKFLSLFYVQGDLKVDNVDVNFSEVYINMHSAFEDSTLEKIKKSILSAIDSIKYTIIHRW